MLVLAGCCSCRGRFLPSGPTPDFEKTKVLAGHGLTYTNIAPIASIEEIVEVNIGHSLVARAVLVGVEQAVREMRRLLG